MSEHNCDDHTHTSLMELHECIATQRRRMHHQMLVVALAILLATGMWLGR